MDPLRRLTDTQRFALARQLRKAAPPAERHAWSLLRNRGVLGLKFRRQHVLHGFIVDFYCAAGRLVLELEGDAHDTSERQSYDVARAEYLEAAGFRVVRVRNRDVTRKHLEVVIRDALKRVLNRTPSPEGRGGQGVRTQGEQGVRTERRGQGVRTERRGQGVRTDWQQQEGAPMECGTGVRIDSKPTGRADPRQQASG